MTEQQPAKTGSAPASPDGGFMSRDVLTGQLAALINGLTQSDLEAAADGLIALGWRPAADPSVTEEILTEHSFMEDDGNGWAEPRTYRYSCSCTEADYALWVQTDPGMTGYQNFREEGGLRRNGTAPRHVAEILAAEL